MLAFSLRKFFWGLLVVVLGLLLWAHNYGIVAFSLSFSRDWPIVIVAAGLMSMWGALFGRHWWGKSASSRENSIPARAKKILEDVENGCLSAEEAIRKMDEK
jgi:hypothetical protein